jgi:hypothetical protein
MVGGVDGGGPIRASIWARGTAEHHEPVADVARAPEPSERPDPHAQWNEVSGRWEVWDEDAQVWVSIDHTSVQAPAAPSQAPHPSAFTHPPYVPRG